ncbi:protein phosphatase 1F isoform X1 [Ciona intestinalis]
MASALDRYGQFLDNYFAKYPEKPIKANTFQYALRNSSVLTKELKGECIYVCLQHLLQSDCPDNLAYIIAKKVSNQVIEKLKQEETASTEYESSAIAELTLQTTYEICQSSFDELSTEAASLPTPPVYSACGIKNTRRKMEDHHLIITNLNSIFNLTQDQPVTQFYGVYDGHGGVTASNYAAKQLHVRYIENDSRDMKTCIQTLDDEFCAKATKEHLHCGSTAVVATVTKSEINISWVGDSQAVLIKNGKPVELTIPHKPERPDEKLRIEGLGGCVVWFGTWRVNGTVAVSRAIGDADHKPYISGEADTVTLPLDGDEEYLCLACDGFWDVFNGTNLINLVTDYMREGGERTGIARHLCIKAKDKGSTDNITVVIVFLKQDIEFKNIEDETKTEEVEKIDETKEENEMPVSPEVSNNNNNNNSRSNLKSGDPPNPGTQYGMVHGVKMKPAEKIKIPHKLLVNFARNAVQQTTVEKEQVIVTESSKHAKLPHTLYSPQRKRPSAFSKSPQRKSATTNEPTRTSLNNSTRTELVVEPTASVISDDDRSVSSIQPPHLPIVITNSLSSTLKPLRPRTVL